MSTCGMNDKAKGGSKASFGMKGGGRLEVAPGGGTTALVHQQHEDEAQHQRQADGGKGVRV